MRLTEQQLRVREANLAPFLALCAIQARGPHHRTKRPRPSRKRRIVRHITPREPIPVQWGP